MLCASKAVGHLWVLERRVDGETRTKARQCLEVGGVGQRPAALSVHGESQRFEVLAVNVPLPTVHRLQQILTGNNLCRTEQQRLFTKGSSPHTLLGKNNLK